MIIIIIQILLLTRASEQLEAEKEAREENKVQYLGENLPPLQLSGLQLEEIQVKCVTNNKTNHTRLIM